MKKTNFDRYLDRQLRDPAFAARFKRAGEAWDVALQISALREKAGLSQKDLAKLLGTSQQQISRLESPGYEGHSLSMLRRVARVLRARVRVVFEPEKEIGYTLRNPRFHTAANTLKVSEHLPETDKFEVTESRDDKDRVQERPDRFRNTPPRQERVGSSFIMQDDLLRRSFRSAIQMRRR